jgi:hypothetical protein
MRRQAGRRAPLRRSASDPRRPSLALRVACIRVGQRPHYPAGAGAGGCLAQTNHPARAAQLWPGQPGLGGLVIGAGLTVRVRPGLGTRLNIALIGFGADRISGERRDPARATLWSSRATGSRSDVSVRVMGLGPALYIRARLGADRRDGLTLGLHPLTGGASGALAACWNCASPAVASRWAARSAPAPGSSPLALVLPWSSDCGFLVCPRVRNQQGQERSAPESGLCRAIWISRPQVRLALPCEPWERRK